MNEKRMFGSLSLQRVIAIIALGLALCFVVSLARKSMEAYELQRWIEQLEAEVENLELQRAELLIEVRRRDSDRWVDQILREAGRLPPGVSRAYPITKEPQDDQELSKPVTTPTPHPTEDIAAVGLFEGEHWEAWMDILRAR